jgi:uncharacterized protein
MPGEHSATDLSSPVKPFKKPLEWRAAGKVAEIWRYPVSSVGGERLTHASLTDDGLDGDRLFALIDAITGLPAAPEMDMRWRKALHLRAEMGERVPTVIFPNSRALPLDHPIFRAALSNYLGFEAAVASYKHHPDFPTVQPRYQVADTHLLTTASLALIARLSGGVADIRRFRPTVLIKTHGAEQRPEDRFPEDRFPEDRWVGRCLTVGTGELVVEEKTARCGMTLLAQPGLNEDPAILRTIVRHNKRRLGVYGRIIRAGSFRVGDTVSLASSGAPATSL